MTPNFNIEALHHAYICALKKTFLFHSVAEAVIESTQTQEPSYQEQHIPLTLFQAVKKACNQDIQQTTYANVYKSSSLLLRVTWSGN